MLHTVFEVQSIHLQAALWMGMSLSQIKKIPSFWQWPPPPLGITEVPGVYFFPFFYVWVSFFFTRAGQVFFCFPSHVGQVFFFLLCVGQFCTVLLFLHAVPHEVKRQVYVRICHSVISAMCRTVKFGHENDLLSKTLKMLKKAENQLEIKVK